MNIRQNRNLVLFLGGLGLLVVILVIGADYLLRLVPVAPPPAGQSLPAIQAEDTDGDTAPVFRIQSGTVDRRPVGYTADGFSPPRIIIQETDSIGCLITILNRSEAPLRVGVSPHEEGGDTGADYGLIAPGASAVLDVRYSGLEGVRLHNHARPEHEFAVAYGPGCD